VYTTNFVFSTTYASKLHSDATLHDENLIKIHNRAKPMRNHKQCVTANPLSDAALDQQVRGHVDGRCLFVQHEDSGRGTMACARQPPWDRFSPDSTIGEDSEMKGFVFALELREGGEELGVVAGSPRDASAGDELHTL
jgi:hypothetical protein